MPETCFITLEGITKSEGVLVRVTRRHTSRLGDRFFSGPVRDVTVYCLESVRVLQALKRCPLTRHLGEYEYLRLRDSPQEIFNEIDAGLEASALLVLVQDARFNKGVFSSGHGNVEPLVEGHPVFFVSKIFFRMAVLLIALNSLEKFCQRKEVYQLGRSCSKLFLFSALYGEGVNLPIRQVQTFFNENSSLKFSLSQVGAFAFSCATFRAIFGVSVKQALCFSLKLMCDFLLSGEPEISLDSLSSMALYAAHSF